MVQWPPPRYASACTVIICNLKAFKRLLLSKVRPENQALEFHVTINQDCIPTEIK